MDEEKEVVSYTENPNKVLLLVRQHINKALQQMQDHRTRSLPCTVTVGGYISLILRYGRAPDWALQLVVGLAEGSMYSDEVRPDMSPVDVNSLSLQDIQLLYYQELVELLGMDARQVTIDIPDDIHILVFKLTPDQIYKRIAIDGQ